LALDGIFRLKDLKYSRLHYASEYVFSSMVVFW